jgi:hypothetical protein
MFAFGLGALCALHAQTPTWPKTTPADVAAAGLGVQLTGADYGNGTFVLAGYFGGTTAVPAFTAAAYTSPDGVTWTRRTLPATTGFTTGKPRFLNGKFFLGLTPSSGGSGIILSSADGVTWTSSGVINSALNAPNDFVFGNGVYVAPVSGGTTQIITSTDGVTWTPRTINNTRSNHVTFFSGKFYASVYPSTIGLYSSTDGVTWAPVTAAPAGPGVLAAGPSILLTTTFGNNVSGQAVSTDGAAFTTAVPGIVMQTETIRYLNGGFVTQKSTVPTSNDLNLAHVSKDGQTWTTLAATTNFSDAADIAFGGGNYVFVGEFNTFTGTATGGPSGGGTTTQAPTVSAQPAAQVVALGGSVTFTFTVTGSGITFQWYFNGVAIAGATSGTYTIGTVTMANAGSYTVTATNAGGTVTSNAALLTVGTATNAAHLSNVSIRSLAGSDSQTLIVGVTVGGAGTSGAKTILVRGSGPALATLGVTGQLVDPVLTGYSGSTQIFANDDWNNDAQVTAQGAALGAFPFPASSKDAALVGTVPAGGYTVQLTGKAGATGVALVEVYDATSSYTTATPRLTNVSARTQVGTGANILITGFVVVGSGTKQLLLRASGPGLIPLGVTGTLVDPKLELYNSSGVKVAENDNWDSSTAAAQTSVGAFALAPGSKDAVLVATLPPGAYTAQVSGANAATGVALVEIYELP